MSGNESSRHRGEARHPWGWRTPRGRAALVAVTGASVVVGGFAVMASMLGTFDEVPPSPSRVQLSFVEGGPSDGTSEASPGRMVVRDPVVISPALRTVPGARLSPAGVARPVNGPVNSPATLTGRTAAATPGGAVAQDLDSAQPTALTGPHTIPASAGSGTQSGSGSGTGQGTGQGTGSGTGSAPAPPTAPPPQPTAPPPESPSAPPPTQSAKPPHHALPPQAKGHQKNPPCGPKVPASPPPCR